jgi:hypothetical protein
MRVPYRYSLLPAINPDPRRKAMRMPSGSLGFSPWVLAGNCDRLELQAIRARDHHYGIRG